MKRRGPSKGGRRNFETWKEKKIPQSSPTEEKQKLTISHSALPSSRPGDPCGPKQPSCGEPLEGGAVRHQQAKQKTHRKKRTRGRTAFSRRSRQHPAEEAWPPPLPFLGTPTHPTLRWAPASPRSPYRRRRVELQVPPLDSPHLVLPLTSFPATVPASVCPQLLWIRQGRHPRVGRGCASSPAGASCVLQESRTEGALPPSRPYPKPRRQFCPPTVQGTKSGCSGADA